MAKYPMLGYQQFNEQVRDAPLYHATTVPRAIQIVSDNRLQAQSYKAGIADPTIDDSWIDADTDHHKSLQGQRVISTTRDIDFALSWAGPTGVVLQLDRVKVAATRMIVPFNYFRSATRERNHTQSEELIVGDIDPLSNCLVRVIMHNRKMIERYWSLTREPRINVLRKHPKLFIWDERDWLNS